MVRWRSPEILVLAAILLVLLLVGLGLDSTGHRHAGHLILNGTLNGLIAAAVMRLGYWFLWSRAARRIDRIITPKEQREQIPEDADGE